MPRSIPRALVAAIAAIAAASALASSPPPLHTESRPAQSAPDDPLAAHLERLAKDRYFRDVAFHPANLDAPPFALLAQRKLKERGDPAGTLARFHAPWLEHLARTLRADYFEPLGLAPAPGSTPLPIALLATFGDYENYLRRHPAEGLHVGYGTYDADLGVIVHPQAVRGDTLAAHWRRYPLLRDAVLALLDVHAAPRKPLPLWLREGLATYHAFHLGHTPDDLDLHRPRPLFLQELIERLPTDQWLHPRDFLKVDSPASFDAMLRLRASANGDAKAAPAAGPRARQDFALSIEMHGWLLVDYLRDAERGPGEAVFRQFLRGAFDGRGRAEDLVDALGGPNLDQLDLALRLHLQARTGGTVGPDPIASAGPGESASSASPGELSLGPAIAAAWAPRDLAEALGLALARARGGDVEGALGALEDSRERHASDGVDAARVERARQRLEALRVARDEALDHVIAERIELRFPQEGPDDELQVLVRERAGDQLLLEPGEHGLERLALRALEPRHLFTSLRRDASRFGPEWMRGYVYGLALDKRWKRFARGEGGDRLIEDFERDLEPLLERGAVLFAAARLAAAGAPATDEEARACWRRLETVTGALANGTRSGGANADEAAARDPRDEASSTEDARRAPLTALARVAASRLFAIDGLSETLGASARRLDDGRLELRYDFHDPRMADDWLPAHDHARDRQERLGTIYGIEEPPRGVECRDGGLEVSGWSCLRHVLDFAAPLRVDASIYYPRGEGRLLPIDVAIRICDGGERSFAAVRGGIGSLTVVDQESGLVSSFEPEGDTMEIDRLYECAIVHDGTELSSWLDGDALFRASPGGLKSGGVYLWVNTDRYVSFQQVAIIGRPTPESLESLAAPWVAARLASLGLE